MRSLPQGPATTTVPPHLLLLPLHKTGLLCPSYPYDSEEGRAIGGQESKISLVNL